MSEPSQLKPQRKNNGLLIGCLIAGVLAGGFVLVVGGGIFFLVMQGKRFEQSQNNMKQLGLAMLQYQMMFGHFPASAGSRGEGEPVHSWRVAILPYLEQGYVYDQYHFDKPWDAPENQAVASLTMQNYQSPRLSNHGQNTSFAVVVGEDTIFPPTKEESGFRGGISPAHIRDGTSNTILVIEIANSDIHWAEPRDISIDQLQRVSDGADPSAANVVPLQAIVGLADGSVHLFGPEITPDLWDKFLHRDDGQMIDWSR